MTAEFGGESPPAGATLDEPKLAGGFCPENSLRIARGGWPAKLGLGGVPGIVGLGVYPTPGEGRQGQHGRVLGREGGAGNGGAPLSRCPSPTDSHGWVSHRQFLMTLFPDIGRARIPVVVWASPHTSGEPRS
jgi:hypothetical protein